MDLGAYANIENLDQIAKDNGIDVPRLRGYRLMKDECIVTQESINELLNDVEISTVKDLCQSDPFWNPSSNCSTYSRWTDYLCNYYLDKNKDGDYCAVRWNRIHGWKRRILKFEIKKNKRAIRKQYETFNKYVGREDVLYIHARIGGNNWKYFDGPTKVANQPWFLEKVDDSYDSTYCDIYAKIKKEK